MFEVIYHEAAEDELRSLPPIIRVKFVKLVNRLQTDPHTKPLGNGVYEIRTSGSDISRGLWVYQRGQKIYILRIFIKKSQKIPPSEIEKALRRLEEMQNEI
ncbi:type II toxin-antitoxin system RelE/ParE family toxin [Pantoea trifolii]|uniref:type II toxin-antitoxin system RelE/ParE family toxin n=1 Tax=Candidatus Pantoea symbiotica TaxID=1884370 RepID=UPI0024138E2E|nr:type II toxin-antitoxin system RelE/ParE family toxin [Pantoea rodasii]